MDVLTEMIVYEAVTCGACQFHFALPAGFVKQRRGDGKKFYCPAGCHVNWSDNTEARLKRELDAETRNRQYYESRAASERAAKEHAQRSAKAYAGHLTRVKRRVANGVCPCCHRHFQGLGAHIKRQHPEFEA